MYYLLNEIFFCDKYIYRNSLVIIRIKNYSGVVLEKKVLIVIKSIYKILGF